MEYDGADTVHTMAYLRRTSSVLFATVLACSSRFFRRDLHSLLGPHAQTALDRAVIQGRSDVGIIQSLMLSTYWKAPADTSAWLKVGMAIRIAYSQFWHIPRTEPLPTDEETARIVLNPERTWFCTSQIGIADVGLFCKLREACLTQRSIEAWDMYTDSPLLFGYGTNRM